MTSDMAELAGLLRERRSVIANHAWRDRDAEAHLRALQSVSERIAAASRSLAGRVPPRLAHFLESCSFDKALAFIETEGGAGCRS